MVPPSVQRPKLSVSFSGSRPPKLSFSIKINHLVHFGLITVETDSLKSFVRSHYPLWMIHNFASNKISPSIVSNKNDFKWDLPHPPQVHYCIGCWFVWAHDQVFFIYKTVVNFWRNLSIHPHLFDNSKTVRRYRDGLIKLVEKPYIFHLRQTVVF